VGERPSGAYLGDVGLFVGRGLGERFDAAPECGWTIPPRAHGRGYATEALHAVHAWWERREGGRTVCMIDPGNAASIRVAEKSGYREFARAAYKEAPTILFERLRLSGTPG
jgi:RimJ/RimL family protein N-acetyltransferase